MSQDRRGAAALEFALLAPTVFAFVFAIFGVALAGFYQGVLDEGVRDAARQLQIAGPAAASEAGFVAAVCRTFGVVAADCPTAIRYQVQASSPAGGFRSLVPVRTGAAGSIGRSYFASGAAYSANCAILVQVSYPLPFTLPYVGSLVTGTGTGAILSTAAVRAEPFS